MADCTIVNNLSYYGAGGAHGSSMYNCINYFNLMAYDSLPSNGANVSLNYCCTSPMPSSGTGNITNAPAFQPDGIHLTASSPCRGAGNLAYASGVDIYGLPWLNPP